MESRTTTNKLTRKLGLFDSSMIMMGIIIGSGIFITTGIMAKYIPSALFILLAWLLGGLITLAGALTYAELGAAMPEAGGQYVYLKEAYGPLAGFLFGWIVFLVYQTGGIAGLAIAFSEYFSYFLPGLSLKKYIFVLNANIFNLPVKLSISYGQLVAVTIITLLSMVNYLGVVLGKIVQNFLTVTKIGILVGFIILGFTLGRGNSINFSAVPGDVGFSHLLVGLFIALISVFWTFDGWNNVTYVAGEIRKPGRNLPLALIIGTLGVTVLYFLINVIYLMAIPADNMGGIERIAEQSASLLFSGPVTGILSAAILISILGSLNGSILTGPRVYYSMAKDQLFFKKAATIHPKFKTPGYAIVIQGLWSCLLALSGTFEQIITFVIFVSMIFWVAAALAVFRLRKKYPDLPRPYKTWGYPVVPALFILVSTAILVFTLIEKPVEALAGLAITAAGIPAYFYWKRRK
jgi:APA family basic amino acid/polyamine antiporter